jgi:hypothetical protein
MRPDRPVIGAVVCLATGVALIVAYCHGNTGFSIVYPFSGSTLHLDLTTNGPAVIGGLFFTAIGVLFLLWSVLAAIVSQITLMVTRDDRMESIVGRYREPSFDFDPHPASITMTERKHES